MVDAQLTDLYGTVVAVQANFYQVRLDSPVMGENLLCTRRARLQKIGQSVMVGDRVRVEEADFGDQQGAIAEVLPRSTEIDRPAVANIEQILLVFALAEPVLDPWLISRFLVKAESTGLEIAVCVNKIDLGEPEHIEVWGDRLASWGYRPFFVSVEKNRGFEALLAQLNHKITLLAGPSGVGKSSLINCLIPEINQRVGDVSGKLQKGRHTTRHVELFALPNRGLLADSPGFNQPDIKCLPEQLTFYFPEVRQRLALGNCQFNDCTHRREPNCVVRGDWERYQHYLEFLEAAIAREQTLKKTSTKESNLKLKIKEAGQETYEPKLANKKYRRPSRRGKNQDQERYENQTLQDIYNDDSE
ncbi:small ribosomal subunit biogenesis GTPase RsgA [Microcystis aeruginosa NIES-2520]|uniref:Small ribosomal subunit biogenesis GTPase RsgA n=1 Tax=Microcystis aeruginosa NIES-2520 TaxID=2303982 RepID=A0A5A5RBY7_MICAE|nr:small ribosomal subunit biogenesis GTPase RsgA [Microcystis aeruginosa]GCA73550.1 small ribosomal subunit biogenesis GTPase RsgA [Microcystis aeruginosa NIES-2520]